MTIHELRIYSQHFAAVLDGTKRAEWRVDDRGYAVGDRLHLREWDPGAPQADKPARFTGRDCCVQVTHKLPVENGFCMLSIQPIDSQDAAVPGSSGDWRVQHIMQAAAELSPRQLSDLRGRLAELASAQAARRGKRR